MRHALAALALASVLALTSALGGPALAAEKAKAKGPEGQYVDLSPLALPVVEHGRLINYIFVTVRLTLAPNADSATWRAKEPYFRDALVRAGHRTPFMRPDSYTRLDDAALKAAMAREAQRIAGPGVVTGVILSNEQARRVVGLPKPPAAPSR